MGVTATQTGVCQTVASQLSPAARHSLCTTLPQHASRAQ